MQYLRICMEEQKKWKHSEEKQLLNVKEEKNYRRSEDKSEACDNWSAGGLIEESADYSSGVGGMKWQRDGSSGLK